MNRWHTDNSVRLGNPPLVRLNRITDGAPATGLPDAGERYLSTALFQDWA